MSPTEKIKASLFAYWESFLAHVPNLLLSLIILVLAILLAGWLSGIFKSRLGSRINDPLLSSFLSRILKTILITLGILLAFHVLGLTGIAGGLLAGAGVGAIIIGLAFQDIGSNFLSGIILAFNRPFNIGDTIQINGYTGKVITLNLRTTQIKTFEGKDVYIPNTTMIKEELQNFTKDGFLRLDFVVGIDYDTDIKHAQRLILEALTSVPGVLQSEAQKPLALVDELAVSTVNLKVYFWVETFDYKQSAGVLKSKAISTVLEHLIAGGIALPADILEIKHYKGKGFPIKMLNKETKD
jgi:small-conductance mechanosensitive channel